MTPDILPWQPLPSGVSESSAQGQTLPFHPTTGIPDVLNVKDFGALGDGATDDTAAIQATINAALTGTGGGTGGSVYLPPGVYVISQALTFKSGLNLFGSACYASQLVQKAGTADVFLKSGAVGSSQKSVYIHDLSFDVTDFINNSASNTGGIVLEGTTMSIIERCRFVACNNAAIQIKGGATQGDAMYNIVRANLIVNIPAGAYGVQLSVSTQVVGGSHPDGTRLVENHVNSGNGTAFRIDPPDSDTAGHLGADSCIIAFNTTIECPTPIDVVTQRSKIVANRFEHTTGTMSILLNNPTPNNFPCDSNVFIANTYATHGAYSSLIFTDNGIRTQQLAEPGAEVTTTQGSPAYKTASTAQVVPTFAGSGAAVTIDPSKGSYFRVAVTDTTAFTINNPSMDVPGAEITIMVRNSSGGVMGAITWGSAYRLGGAFTNPANGLRRSITFRFDSVDGLWYEKARTTADM